MAIKRYAGALFDSMVVVTMMTTLGLIVGILALAITYSGLFPLSGKIIALCFVICFVIGLIGVITIVLQVRAITKQKRLRNDLTVLYLEGVQLTNQLAANYTDDGNAQVADWKRRVVEFLSKDMESSHVMRFQTADLRVLVEFIKELGG